MDSPAGLNPQAERVDAVDLVIGIMTAGESGARLPAMARIVEDGMSHLAGLSAALVHVDATLPDEQAGKVEQIAEGIRLVHARTGGTLAVGDGRQGWSDAVRAVLLTSRSLQARAIVMLNPGISSMTPDWIRGLAQPILKEGCGFVLPVYERGVYEGTLTQVFVLPLVRALFGHQFWHPMADEFGCSGEVAEYLLGQDVWDTDLARQGLEFWLPVAVAAGALPVAQSVLGPRVLVAATPAPLGATVGRVAAALFSTAERHEAGWLEVTGSEPVALFGMPAGPSKGSAAAVNPERMLEGFRQGVRDLLPIWERILAPENLGDVLALSEQAVPDFRLGDRLWARIVYDFLLAYRARVMYRNHITQSLAPLYLGCAASLVLATRGGPDPAVAAAVERLARAFENEKPYLVDRWR